MPASTPARRSLVAATAAVAVLALSACGSNASSATAAKDNPYGLQQAGTIRVATLTDAPPNVFLKDGKFTGFDNDLLTAVAGKLGLKVQFVGTDFSALLAQVKNKKFDLGSSSITITDARKKTVDFTNGYDFGYFGLDVPAGSAITAFDQLKGKRVAVVQGTVQDDYATKEGLNPVRVPDYNSALNQLKSGTAAGLGRPRRDRREDRQGQRRQGHPASAKQLSSAPTAFAVAPGNTAFRTALDTALDQVIKDGTWTRLQEQYYPGRPVPKDFTPGSGTVAVPAGQGRRRGADRADGHPADAPGDLPRPRAPWARRCPSCSRSACATPSSWRCARPCSAPWQGCCWPSAGCPGRAGCAGRPASTPTSSVACPAAVTILLIGVGLAPVGLAIWGPNPYPLGILALSLIASAYIGEIFRSGIQSVEAGQLEAARALGFSRSTGMRLVVIPQGVRRVLPALVNQLIALIKESSPGLLPGAARDPARPVPHRPGPGRQHRQRVGAAAGGPVLPRSSPSR